MPGKFRAFFNPFKKTKTEKMERETERKNQKKSRIEAIGEGRGRHTSQLLKHVGKKGPTAMHKVNEDGFVFVQDGATQYAVGGAFNRFRPSKQSRRRTKRRRSTRTHVTKRRYKKRRRRKITRARVR
jgi:hypothetical protein